MSEKTETDTVEVSVKETRTETREVEFPIYRVSHEMFGRVDIDRSAIHVGVKRDSRSRKDETTVEFEFREDYNLSEGSGEDYHLGKGVYSASRERFEKRYKEGLILALENAPESVLEEALEETGNSDSGGLFR